MPSIGVLEPFQNPSEQPARRIKKSGGQSLVNQGRAEWVKRNVLLRMIPADMHPAKTPAPKKHYIPFGLEPLIDARIGVIEQMPVLPEQVRFRHFR